MNAGRGRSGFWRAKDHGAWVGGAVAIAFVLATHTALAQTPADSPDEESSTPADRAEPTEGDQHGTGRGGGRGEGRAGRRHRRARPRTAERTEAAGGSDAESRASRAEEPAREPITGRAREGSRISRGDEAVEVRVIGHRADAVQKIPGSANTITKKDIDRMRPFDTAEVLRRLPGMTARQDRGAGMRLDIGVRGLDPGRSRRVLILEDGIPVAINPYAEPDLYYVPPVERLRGVEAVKGSGAILFGPQTVGGVVNLLTLQPPSQRRATLDVEGGMPRYGRVLGSYGDDVGAFRYIVQVFHKRGETARLQPYTATDVFTKLAFSTSRTGEATLKIGIHDDTAISDAVGLTREMYGRDPYRETLSPHNDLHLRRYELSLIHRQRIADRTQLKTLAYGYITNRSWERQDYDRFADPSVRYERIVGDVGIPNGAIYFRNSQILLDRRYQVAGLEPRLEHRIEGGPVAHKIDVGARMLGEGAEIAQRHSPRLDSSAGDLEIDETHQTLAFAGYVHDRIGFRPDLFVTPGVRVEHARYRRSVYRELSGAGPIDVFQRGTSEASGVIPGVGMTYGKPKAHVFAGIHSGFAPPRVFNAITPRGDDEKLKAERSTNYELGTRLRSRELGRAGLTGFASNFANQIVADTEGGVIVLVNGGTTRHVGIESDVVWTIGKMLDLPVMVDIGGRYTFQDARFVGGSTPGNLLPYAPRHIASVNLDVEHESGFGGQVAWHHTGPQFSDPNNTTTVDVTGRQGVIDSQNLVDAILRYKHARSGLSIRLALKGLVGGPFVVSRRPEGTFAGGFRQIILGLRWDHDLGGSGEKG